MQTAQQEAAPQSTAALRSVENNKAAMATVTPGFGNGASFDLLCRQARVLYTSSLVPPAYREVTIKYNKDGSEKSRIENPNAQANCIIALNMAIRLSADPVMVCQNLNVIEGKPSWSAKWITAEINNAGKFSGLLKYVIKDLGKKTVNWEGMEWISGTLTKVTKPVEIHDMSCVAWAIEKGTGERIESSPVTIEMAVKEGWYTKSGSKWQTMPQNMLENRSASFFGNKYIPERLVGLPSTDELLDIIDVVPGPDGKHAADLNELRREAEEMRQRQQQSGAAGQSAGPDKNAGAQVVETRDSSRPSVAENGESKPSEGGAEEQAASAATASAEAPDANDSKPSAVGSEPTDSDLISALAFVEAGDFDLAQDTARFLSEAGRKQVNDAIELKKNPTPAARTKATRQNRNLKLD